DPVVQSVFKTVQAGLKIVDAESGEQFTDYVRFAVAFGVFRIDDVRGGADEHAVSPHRYPGREWKIIQEHGRFVVNAVASSRFENANPAARLVFTVDAGGVIEHLGD